MKLFKSGLAFVAGSYALSLASGLAQFVALVFLQGLVTKEDFSRISVVLSAFSTLFLLVELGIQGELVRLFTQQGPKQDLYGAAVRLRLFGAFFAVLSVFLYALVGEASVETVIGMIVFSLVLFPAARLYVLEAEGYATRNVWHANALRAGRLFAMVIFVVVCLVTVNATQRLTELHYAVLFGSFVFTLTFVSLFTKLRLTSTSEPALSLGGFVKNSSYLMIARFFVWVFNFLFASLNMRIHGDTNLAEFNVAQTLVVPLTLLTQVLYQFSLSNRFKQGQVALPSSTLGIREILLSFLGVCLYGMIFSNHFVVTLFFKNVDVTVVQGYMWPLLISTVFILVGSVAEVECQAFEKKKSLIVGQWVAIALLVLLTFGLFKTNQPHLMGYVYSICTLGWCLVVSVASKKARQLKLGKV